MSWNGKSLAFTRFPLSRVEIGASAPGTRQKLAGLTAVVASGEGSTTEKSIGTMTSA